MNRPASDVARLRTTLLHPVILDPLSAIAFGAALAKLGMVRLALLGTPAVTAGALGDVLFLLALALLTHSVAPSGHGAGTYLFAALTSLMLFVTLIYARYYDEIPTLALLRFAGQARAETAAIGSLLRVSDLVLFLDLPLLIALGRLLPRPSRPLRRHILPRLLASAALCTAAITVPPMLTALPFDDPRVAPRALGLFAYQIAGSSGDLVDTRTFVAPSGRAALQRTIDELSGRAPHGRLPGAPAPGSYRGAPVILIQAEALQSGLISARIAGQPVMPNLERFAAESWYFPNMLSQIGKANTADAEFIANTSLYPATDRPSPVAYGTKVLPSLPRLLRAHGYRTFTMHANDVRFWNRNQLYPALGFDRYYDRAFFGRREDTGHGTSDAIFFERALPVLIDAAREGPFYAHLVTVSAHYPFKNPFGHGTLELPERVARTETGRYLRLQSYADSALGRFLDALGGSGLLDTAIVIIYGDHFGMRLDATSEPEEQLRREIYGRPYNRADFYTVPLIVHLPGQRTGRRVEHAVGQVDILPTIADLVGVDLSDTVHFGRSVFVRTPTVLTKGGALDLYVDDELFYLHVLGDEQPNAFSTRTHLRIRPERPISLDNVRRLLALSAAYAASLPERSGDTGSVGVIPTGRARTEPGR